MVVVENRARLRKPGQAGQRAGERVDLDQVAVDVDAGPPRGLDVGADRVRVAAEARELQDRPRRRARPRPR